MGTAKGRAANLKVLKVRQQENLRISRTFQETSFMAGDVT